jgi:nicotinamide mononucleotide transporter
MREVLDWLYSSVVTVGDDAISVAELLGFITGAYGVWLVVRERIGNFPVGIANSAFFLVLFFDAELYANAGLQVVYIALGLAGWWMWLHGGAGRAPIRLTRSGGGELFLLAVGVVAATIGLTFVLRAADSAAPFWDALTTALSLAAQLLLNRKKLENWYVWAVADVIYIPLYASQGLYLTSAVYLLMLGLCIAGLRRWRRSLAVSDRAVLAEVGSVP